MVYSNSAFSYDRCQSPVDADLPPCLHQTNSALTDVYDELMNVIQTPLLDEHEKSDLRKDQLQWLKLRDQQCKLKLNIKFNSIDEWMHSIEADKTKSRCVVEQTIKRIDGLEQTKKKKEEAIKQNGYATNASITPSIPDKGQNILDFIPRGYAIFEKIEKDFNGDDLKDVAMILRPVMPNEFDPRPFLILQAKTGGGYVLSAQNDQVAPNGEGGGISNPYGADSLKSKGRSILIEESGGSSTSGHSNTFEFRLLNNTWYLVSQSEAVIGKSIDSSICKDEASLNLSGAWQCVDYEVQTNFVTGEVVEKWNLYNNKTNQDRTKHTHRHVDTKELIMLDNFSYETQLSN
jgi:uncharacterized protein YecT (DUF1311 family)